MNGIDEFVVDLQQWLAARTHNELRFLMILSAPGVGDRLREIIGSSESSAIGADTDEIRIAELAYGA